MGISNTFKKMENYIKFSPYRRKLYHLRGKKIAIDTSIYMWKFKTSDHSLGIYQFVTFINLLLKYEIIPIFIMDGRPTPLKSDEIQKRKKKNREILELIRKYDESPEENPEIRKRIEKLRISSKIVTGSDWNSWKIFWISMELFEFGCTVERPKDIVVISIKFIRLIM
jgi:5'-3' exonuclease